MVPPPIENTVDFYNQITLYYISSILVTLLKIIDARIQISDTFYLLLVSSSPILSFKYSFFFVPEMSSKFAFLHCVDYLHCLGLDQVTTAF
jgi:hypothetical protein